MKKALFILAILGVTFISCDKEVIPKPRPLIREKQMVNMLVDIHLAEAMFNHLRYDTLFRNSSSVNFYYSVLQKYEVADSVFEKSFVYYASNPRNFEKMYREVMNKLSETEQGFSGRKQDILEFQTPE